MAIYQGLYGVELTCPQKKAKELYEKAKEKAKEVKSTSAATGDGIKQAVIQTPSLSDIGEAKNMMDPERICKLNAVGFEWELQKDTYVESWENRYNQLLKFKVINGHCRVPKSSGDNPQLGQWVKQVCCAVLRVSECDDRCCVVTPGIRTTHECPLFSLFVSPICR